MTKNERVCGDHRGLIIIEVDNFLGVADQWTGIARQEMFAPSDSDHQGASKASRDQQIWNVSEKDCKSVCAFDLFD